MGVSWPYSGHQMGVSWPVLSGILTSVGILLDYLLEPLITLEFFLKKYIIFTLSFQKLDYYFGTEGPCSVNQSSPALTVIVDLGLTLILTYAFLLVTMYLCNW